LGKKNLATAWAGERQDFLARGKPKKGATQRVRDRRERNIDFILSPAIPSFIKKRLGILNAFCVVSWPFEFFSLYLCVSVSV
jgi:hypothetical protein